MAGPLGRAPHQRARPRRRRAAVLQPHDVPLPLGRGAARGEHVRLHRQRHLRPVQAAAGVRRLRADRLRRVRHPQRELRDQAGHQPRRPDPAEHRATSAASSAASAACSTGATSCPPPIPAYYKWTQWIFLQLFKAGKAYKKAAAVNWCPHGQDRAGQRAGHQRPLRALRHGGGAADAGAVVLPDHRLRRPAAGRSGRQVEDGLVGQHRHGAAQLAGPVGGGGARLPASRGGAQADGDAGDDVIRVFTTRPDTVFGATFMVLAPEHPLVDAPGLAGAAARRWTRTARPPRRRTWSPARWASGRRPASSPAATPINPATGKPIPVWIADYVLMEYGTGAIMAVPGHDERDFEFAAEVRPADRPRSSRRSARPRAARHRPSGERATCRATRRPTLPYTDNEQGVLVNSGQFDGLTRPRGQARHHRLARRAGRRQGRRQLPPARLVHLPPALLGPADPHHLLRRARRRPGPGEGPAGRAPDDRGLPARTTPASPRSRATRSWYHVPCPVCGKQGRRETDVSDTFLDSAWYYLRYPSTEFDDRPFDPARTRKWLPVTTYIGGNEHAVLAPPVLALHHDGAARAGARSTSTSRSGSSGPTA